MSETKTILVTGASGFIGRHLIERLSQPEIRLRAFDFKKSFTAPGMEWIEGRIEKIEAVQAAMQGVSGVVHLAGISRLGDGFLRPHECMHVNMIGSLNILETARLAPAPPWIILGSTREVQEKRFSNDHVFFQNARGVYGLSKLCGELLGERYACDYGLRVLTLRFSDVYGSPRDSRDRVLPKFLMQALRGNEIDVTETPDARDFTFYEDTIGGLEKGMAFVEALTASRYEVATLCTGRATSLSELASLIVRLAGSRSRIRHRPPTEADSFRNSPLQNDTERAFTLLGFRAQISLEEGIRRSLEAYHPLIKESRSGLAIHHPAGA